MVRSSRKINVRNWLRSAWQTPCSTRGERPAARAAARYLGPSPSRPQVARSATAGP